MLHEKSDAHTGSGSRRELSSFLSSVVFLGAVWGALEATLGYVLHVLPRVTGLPPMAGFVMFPVGVALMLTAVHATGKPTAVLGVAVAAAAVKLSSVAFTPATWVFVQNPTIAIVCEGFVVFAFAGLLGFGKAEWTIRRTATFALAASVSWRAVFIAAHLVLGIRWGLLERGPAAVLGFLVVDSLVNGVLITLLVRLATPRRIGSLARSMLRPVPAAAALAVALIAELTMSSL